MVQFRRMDLVAQLTLPMAKPISKLDNRFCFPKSIGNFCKGLHFQLQKGVSGGVVKCSVFPESVSVRFLVLRVTIWATFGRVQNQSPISVFYPMKKTITLSISWSYREDECDMHIKPLPPLWPVVNTQKCQQLLSLVIVEHILTRQWWLEERGDML